MNATSRRTVTLANYGGANPDTFANRCLAAVNGAQGCSEARVDSLDEQNLVALVSYTWDRSVARPMIDSPYDTGVVIARKEGQELPD